jgi:hypothetical protein
MDAQDFRSLQEAYLDVYESSIGNRARNAVADDRLSADQQSTDASMNKLRAQDRRHKKSTALARAQATIAAGKSENTARAMHPNPGVGGYRMEQADSYDIILSHLLDERYAETIESAEAIMVNMSEEWRQDIMEKENSEYERASDAALDSRYGYGRASGDKRSFGRAANRSSAAAALRALRRGKRSGSGTSTEAGADAVHQGWARTAKTSTDQTPEKKERRAKLANTPYSQLPDDEKEKDRVSFNAVKAVYKNRNR